jgi:hypothetical protein
MKPNGNQYKRCFGRANRGLLTEASALEEAGASPATGTKRRSALALAAMQPTNGAKWPKEGRVWRGWDGGN